MRRLLCVAIAALWGCHPGAGGPPSASSAEAGGTGAIENLFAQDEQSTSFASQTLRSCMSGIEQAEAVQHPRQAPVRSRADEPRASTKPHVKAWYCVCMADAMGVSKNPTVSADEAGARCVDFAAGVTRKTPTTTRTPYSGNSFLTVSQMADALKGCRVKLEQQPKTQALAELQKETFCSCVVDSMRFRRTTSTNVPVAETRLCAEAAGWSW